MTLRTFPFAVVALAMALAVPASAAEPAPAAPKTSKKTAPRSPINTLYEQGRYGSAVFRCDRAESAAADTGASLPAHITDVCAQANLKLGDKLARVRSFREAVKRWRKAGKLDPRLLDDPAYAQRLETGKPPSSSDTSNANRPPTKTTRPKSTRFKPSPRRNKQFRPRVARPKPKAKPEAPTGPKGPRTGRVFGLGISGGWDGILTVALAWMHAERISIEVATGIFFRTVDTRIKVYGFKEVVTPFIGVGMLTPFGPRAKNPSGGQRVLPRYGLDIPRYGNLYAIGQMVHVDVGLSLAVWKADITAGASFYTSFNQDDPNRVLFFPQFGAQVMFYFP